MLIKVLFCKAFKAALLVINFKSEEISPSVSLARFSKSMSSLIGLSSKRRRNNSHLAFASGRGIKIRLSILPERKIAGSIRSGKFVAPIT